MRRVASAIVLSSAFALVGRAQQPARDTPNPVNVGTASIRGRVVSADTGDTLRKVRIIASADSGRVDPVFTDADGRFQLLNLPAGRYVLSAHKAGFASTRYGARRMLDPPIAVDITDGAVVDNVEIRMPKGAAIMGRIVDDLGDPMPLVPITASRLVRTGGHLRSVAAGSGLTDDLGEYRIGGLAAGSYIVHCSAGTMMYSAGINSGWAPAVYPGGSSVADARPIGLRAGDEVSAIDFRVTLARMPKVTITVTDTGARPVTDATSVTFLPNSSFAPTEGTQAYFFGGGRPTTVSVGPGEFLVIARGEAGGAIVPTTIADDMSLNVVLTKGAQLEGRVVLESSLSLPDTGFVLESIIANRPYDDPAEARVTATVNRDGTFRMTNLFGAREFRLRGPRGWMLKALTHQGRSLLDGPIELKAGETLSGVVAVLTNRVPILTGAVLGRDQRPASDYSVLVFPEDRSLLRNVGRWARWARPDHTGRFTIDDLPPGNYLAVALDEVDEAEWATADYLDRFRPHATVVTLIDGTPKAIVLDLDRPQ